MAYLNGVVVLVGKSKQVPTHGSIRVFVISHGDDINIKIMELLIQSTKRAWFPIKLWISKSFFMRAIRALILILFRLFRTPYGAPKHK